VQPSDPRAVIQGFIQINRSDLAISLLRIMRVPLRTEEEYLSTQEVFVTNGAILEAFSFQVSFLFISFFFLTSANHPYKQIASKQPPEGEALAQNFRSLPQWFVLLLLLLLSCCNWVASC